MFTRNFTYCFLCDRYTQRGGVRPFGVSSILAGFGPDGKPLIYQIDPSGTYFSWKANAIGGKNSKGMKEYLEKEWTEGLVERDALKLTVKTLLEASRRLGTGEERSCMDCFFFNA
jgi:20S proteasome alpha/beta subunit